MLVARVASIVLLLGSPAQAQSVLFTAEGSHASQFGRSTDVIGDVDLDGVADLVVGASAQSAGGSAAGAFHVLSGLDGSTLYKVEATSQQALMGWTVSRLGDVNADGRPDFLVLTEDSAIGGDGVASVRSGLDGAELYAFHDEFGATSPADDAGDVDGDGVADFLVGNLGFPHATYAGRVWVRSGVDGSAIHTFTGTIGGDMLYGRAVAGVGDLDGDGLGDFAFSSRDTLFGLAVYRVQVRSGGDGSLLYALGEPDYDFGSLIESAGDVDGDGVPDLLVGRRASGLYAGELHVHSGATGLRLYTVQGECQGLYGSGSQTSEIYPEKARGLGDLDGDGRDDFGVTSVRGHGARIHSGADGALLAVLMQPAASQNHSGILSIAGGADLDGDGRNEVIVGHATYGSLAPVYFVPGRVRVYNDITTQTVGTALGFGDGSGTPCPCGNTGQTGAGCANSTGLGGVLQATGSTSVAADDSLYFEADRLPPYAQTLLITAATSNGGGLGVPFGDGLLVTGPDTKRVWPRKACQSGKVYWGSGLSDEGGWTAGDTRFFQAWYRDPSGPCASTANLTQALELVFVP